MKRWRERTVGAGLAALIVAGSGWTLLGAAVPPPRAALPAPGQSGPGAPPACNDRRNRTVLVQNLAPRTLLRARWRRDDGSWSDDMLGSVAIPPANSFQLYLPSADCRCSVDLEFELQGDPRKIYFNRLYYCDSNRTLQVMPLR